MGAAKDKILEDGHWKNEKYKQRITAKQWKDLLLNDDDTIIFEGNVRRLEAQQLFPGVLEIRKKRLPIKIEIIDEEW